MIALRTTFSNRHRFGGRSKPSVRMVAVLAPLLLICAIFGSIVFAQEKEPLTSVGQRLATSSVGRVAYGWEDELGVVDYRADRTISLHPVSPDGVNSVAISPDGRLVAATQEARVHLWNVDSRQQIASVSLPGIQAATFVPQRDWLAVLHQLNRHDPARITLVSTSEPFEQRSIDVDGCSGGPLVASADGSALATGSQDLCLVDLATGLVTRSRLPGFATGLAFSNAGDTLAVTVSRIPRGYVNLLLLNRQTLGEVQRLEVRDDPNSSSTPPLAHAFWSPDDTFLVLIDTFGTAYFTLTGDGTVVATEDVGDPNARDAGIDFEREFIATSHRGAHGYFVTDIGSEVSATEARIETLAQQTTDRVDWTQATLANSDNVVRTIKEGTSEQIRQLLDAGLDPNLRDDEGVTLLMHASVAAEVAVAEALLEAGANATATDQEGATALHYAARHNDDQWVARVLVEAGADPNATDASGAAPSDALEPEIAAQLATLYQATRPVAASGSSDTGVPPTSPQAMPGVEPVQAPASAEGNTDHGKRVAVRFTSDPPGLGLLVAGREVGSTPATVELQSGERVAYRIEGDPPRVHDFDGQLVVPDAASEHPTFMPRFTTEERAAYSAAQRADEPALSPAPSNEAPRANPQSHSEVYDSATGRPAPPAGQDIVATPAFVVNFVANELELTDVSCPQIVMQHMICGLTPDDRGTVQAIVQAVFDIYLQPAQRTLGWRVDSRSGATIGGFDRPEGTYAISIADGVVSLGYVGP